MNRELIPIFPTPIYTVKRETELSTSEIEHIKIAGKKYTSYSSRGSKFTKMEITDFFEDKLKSLKEFCIQNVYAYVNEVITPKNKELDFYITESWVNIYKPGEVTPGMHYHANNLISGVFYVSVEKGDAFTLYDRNIHHPTQFQIEPEKWHSWNHKQMDLAVENNLLIIFPSRMNHAIKENPERTTDRISIAFNIFVKGIGVTRLLNELIM